MRNSPGIVTRASHTKGVTPPTQNTGNRGRSAPSDSSTCTGFGLNYIKRTQKYSWHQQHICCWRSSFPLFSFLTGTRTELRSNQFHHRNTSKFQTTNCSSYFAMLLIYDLQLVNKRQNDCKVKLVVSLISY